jgi:hypothetical protein
MPFQYDAFIQRFVTSLLDISKSRASRKLLEIEARRNPFLYLTEINGFDFT